MPPVSQVKLRDFFRHYRGLPHQEAAVHLLQAMMPVSLLSSDADWVVAYRSAVDPKDDEDWVAAAVKFIAKEEAPNGEPVLEAYLDAVGIPTIGLGTIHYADGQPVRMGDKITREEAFELMRTEISGKIGPSLSRMLAPWPAFSDGQKVALASWAYNVGLGAVEASTLRRRMNAGEDPAEVVRQELPRWNKGMINGEKRPIPGLTYRRKREVRLFLSSESEAESKPVGVVIPPGMVGPASHPSAFGFKAGDYHLIVNDKVERVAAYDFQGKRLWELPALARGQGADTEWKTTGTDTPPGLYRVGAIYRDLEAAGNSMRPNETRDRRSYGWYSLDLEDLEGQEQKVGRSGIMVHGGGTACGWPGAWAPMQPLVPTLGCVRMHNVHLRDHVMPLVDRGGTVYVSVLQEKA